MLTRCVTSVDVGNYACYLVCLSARVIRNRSWFVVSIRNQCSSLCFVRAHTHIHLVHVGMCATTELAHALRHVCFVDLAPLL